MNNINQFNQAAEDFFKNIDDLIAANIESLTCNDIFEIYKGLFVKLKEYRGNSSGFTGYSEFLIFRLILNILGGNFLIDQKELSSSTKTFINDKYKIQQGGPTIINGKKIFPDILIKEINNPKVLKFIEIKVVLTNGKKTLDDTWERLANINKYSNSYTVLIIFGISKNSRNINSQIEKYALDKWFNCIKLEGNDKLFSNTVKSYLNL
jgi:hypothetical protein